MGNFGGMSDRVLLATAALSAITGAVAFFFGRDQIHKGALVLGFGLAFLFTAIAAFAGAMVKRRRLSNTAAQWIVVGASLVILIFAFVYGETA